MMRFRSSIRDIALVFLMAFAVSTPATAQVAGGPVQPFIFLEATPSVLDLGDAVPLTPGVNSPATLTLKLYANLTHGGVLASLSPLVHAGGAEILPSQILIKLAEQSSYTPMASPINLTGPRPPGYFLYTLQFRIETPGMYPAGEYHGTLTLTYGVAP